jgi:nucleoside-diphosphate-sugar epimerase
MAMRTVLVTGGAGFIGSHLVDQLLEDGAAVRVLDNLSTGSASNLRAAAERHSRAGGVVSGSRLEVIIGDVRDRALLRTALRGVKYVFHLAALPPGETPNTGLGEIHAVNVDGTLNVLQAAMTEGVWRVVLGSCASVYGRPESIPVLEEAPLRPASLFGASKVAAEMYCRAFHARHQLDTVSLRYFTVYGPRQREGAEGSLVPALFEAVRRRRLPDELSEQSGEDLTYVDDAVGATLAAGRAPRAAGRAINVGSGQMARIADVLRLLGELLKVEPFPVIRPDERTEPRAICASTVQAAELLDFTPRVPLATGLERVARAMVDGESSERLALTPAGLGD